MSEPGESLRDRLYGPNPNEPSRLELGLRLARELVSLSADFTGSDPGDFFDARDADLCREFIELSSGKPIRWSPLDLKTKQATVDWRVVWTGHGINIGKTLLDSNVFLCQDGRLRSFRGREFRERIGVGYGTLPHDARILTGNDTDSHLEGGEYVGGGFVQRPLSDILYNKLMWH